VAIRVNKGSKFCCFCGGQTVTRDGFMSRQNAPIEPRQQSGRTKRRFCEHWGCPEPGGVQCRRCRRLAQVP